MSQRKVLRGKRRAGVEASDDEQSEEEQHRRQRYPRSPSSHTKRKSMHNHVYGIFGRDTHVTTRPENCASITVTSAPPVLRTMIALPRRSIVSK